MAERGGRIVGALIAAWDGWRGNMYRLAVAGDQRRQGIARRLVGAGEERLRALGAQRVTALVSRDDTAAVALGSAVRYSDDVHIARFARKL